MSLLRNSAQLLLNRDIMDTITSTPRPSNDNDDLVDELLRDYYRGFLEADSVAEPTPSLPLDCVPISEKPRKDK